MPDEFDNALDRTIAEIETRAVRGLDEALRFAHDRARKYAPVRAIFARTRRGRAIPGLRTAGGSSAQVMRAYQMLGFNKIDYRRFRLAQAPNKRFVIPKGSVPAAQKPKLDKYGNPQGSLEAFHLNQRIQDDIPHGQRYGHSNSLYPIAPGDMLGEHVTGDFRQVRNGKLVPVAYASRVRGGQVKIHVPEVTTDRHGRAVVPTAYAERLLTSRGRYEVESGRANFKSGRGEEERVGGRLRGSIVIVKPAPTERGVMGYVQAGGAEAYYARFQEFGTRHNRAQPFLRPALYESRKVLVQRVSGALRGR